MWSCGSLYRKNFLKLTSLKLFPWSMSLHPSQFSCVLRRGSRMVTPFDRGGHLDFPVLTSRHKPLPFSPPIPSPRWVVSVPLRPLFATDPFNGAKKEEGGSLKDGNKGPVRVDLRSLVLSYDYVGESIHKSPYLVPLPFPLLDLHVYLL